MEDEDEDERRMGWKGTLGATLENRFHLSISLWWLYSIVSK